MPGPHEPAPGKEVFLLHPEPEVLERLDAARRGVVGDGDGVEGPYGHADDDVGHDVLLEEGVEKPHLDGSERPSP
jgi:hypothetical protein